MLWTIQVLLSSLPYGNAVKDILHFLSNDVSKKLQNVKVSENTSPFNKRQQMNIVSYTKVFPHKKF